MPVVFRARLFSEQVGWLPLAERAGCQRLRWILQSLAREPPRRWGATRLTSLLVGRPRGPWVSIWYRDEPPPPPGPHMPPRYGPFRELGVRRAGMWLRGVTFSGEYGNTCPIPGAQ